MLGVYFDLRADERWVRLVEVFAGELRRLVPGVVKVAALSGPEERVYDSNVLVVVEGEVEFVERLVVDAAMEAERQTGLHGVLSPITCTARDPLLERFMSTVEEQEVHAADWVRLVEVFAGELRRLVPGVVKVAALSGPEERVYDSNVLVVVEGEVEFVERLVVDAAMEAERQTGLHGVLSPITCTARDPLTSSFPSSFTVDLTS